MRNSIALLILHLCASSAFVADDKAALAKLEGRWRVTSIVAVGREVVGAKGVPSSLVVKGGKATFFAGVNEMPTFRDLTLRPDPATGSKAIDLVRDETSTLPCLYEVSGDELKLAMPMVPENRKPGELLPRPDSFDSKDKPVLVLTLKRMKD